MENRCLLQTCRAVCDNMWCDMACRMEWEAQQKPKEVSLITYFKNINNWRPKYNPLYQKQNARL